MREPRVLPPGAGEVVGDSPERRVEILCEHDLVHATWTRYAPGRPGAEPDIHRTHHDVFFVLEGSLTLLFEGGSRVVGAGSLVCVPPMVVHGFRNDGDAELRYLNLHTPGTGFADYMRGLGRGEKVPFDQEPPPSGVRPSSEIMMVGGGVTVGGVSLAEVESASGAFAVYVLEGADAGTWAQG